MSPNTSPPAPNEGDREAVAAAQLAKLGDITSPDFRARLKALEREVRPETLVALIRAARDAPDAALVLELGEMLVGRGPDIRHRGGHCEGLILFWARQWGLADDEDDLKDFRQAGYKFLWRAITQPEYERPWLLRNFPHTVELILKMARDEVVTNRQRRGREEDLDDSSYADSETLARVDAGLAAAAESIDIRRALDSLPPLEARAIELRYVHGLVPGADGPGPGEEKTVASEMGISAGMVRRHLRNARRRLLLNPTVAEFIARLGGGVDEPEGETAP